MDKKKIEIAMKAIERIAKEKGISEEEAYKMFLKGEY